MTDETKDQGKKKKEAKPRKAKEKDPSFEDGAAEYQISEGPRHPIAMRDERGRLLPGASLNPGGNPSALAKFAHVSLRFREMIKKAGLDQVVEEIADGTRRGDRVQMEAIKMVYDRAYGRSPETHLVGAMDPEQREALSTLSRSELLGILDTVPALPEATSAASMATVDVQPTDTTEPTD